MLVQVTFMSDMDMAVGANPVSARQSRCDCTEGTVAARRAAGSSSVDGVHPERSRRTRYRLVPAQRLLLTSATRLGVTEDLS